MEKLLKIPQSVIEIARRGQFPPPTWCHPLYVHPTYNWLQHLTMIMLNWFIFYWIFSLIELSHFFNTLHYISLYWITLNFISLDLTVLYYFVPNYIALHCKSSSIHINFYGYFTSVANKGLVWLMLGRTVQYSRII